MQKQIHYILQENVFREGQYKVLEQTLQDLGLDYVKVRVFPFVDKIVDVEELPNMEGNYDVDDLPEYCPPQHRKIFVLGSIKLSRIAKEKGWYPGTMMNENHDYMVYKEYWGKDLLNGDSIVQKFSDPVEFDTEYKFIRPVGDTKAFTGQVFDKDQWRRMRDWCLKNLNGDKVLTENTLIQVNTPKIIEREVRFWVINGRVVTGSTYRIDNKHDTTGEILPQEFDYAQRMVDKFRLAEAFVIDICRADGLYKIVEAGCINAAGFYNINIRSMIETLNGFLKERY